MVETYLEEELAGLVTEVEQNEEWKKLVADLDLKGQQNMLLAKDKSPIPFAAMNMRTQRVYMTLCPNRQPVRDFAGGTIPLRVLSIIALCKRERYFKRIEVWSDTQKPDPVLVGFTSENDWNQGTAHLLARWGDELRAFVELEKMAVERKTAQWKRELSEHLNMVDSDVEDYLSGDFVNITL